MPENVKELRRRIRSIRNTRKITRAMEMVSASKLKRTESALLAAGPYNERLTAMLRRLVASGDTPPSPLFERRAEVKTRLVVTFAADRGLCGAYNNSLLKALGGYLEQSANEGIAVRAYPVGRRAFDFFRKKRADIPREGEVAAHTGRVSVELAREIADVAIKCFTEGRCDEVVFFYNKFVSTSKYVLTIEKFLPFDLEALGVGGNGDAAATQTALDYIYEPGADRVFEMLLPRFIQSRVYVALASAMTSEHAARMLAMNSATKNCGELIDKLTLRMNKARQAQITTEIIEIVSGAQAIQA